MVQMSGIPAIKVVLATIATSSFREWNFHRYSINKTDVLKFYEDYDEMQDRLHSVLREINQFITELNCKNNKFQVPRTILHTYDIDMFSFSWYKCLEFQQ
jgi:hypothetical protein